MAYNKHEWQDGELITESSLNNIENNIPSLINFKDLEYYVKNSEELFRGNMSPEYVRELIPNIAAKLKKSNFNVGFVTDNHFQYGGYSPNGNYHYFLSGILSQILELDAYVVGGDNINGDQSKSDKYNQLLNVTESILGTSSEHTDVFFLLGNHDTGIGQTAGGGAPNLSVVDNIGEDDMKRLYKSTSPIFGEVRNGDSLYSYKDYPDKKIRMIMLNSFDLPFTATNGKYDFNFLSWSGFQNNQLSWLANTALMLPDNTWEVVIFSHAPISGSFGNNSNGSGLNQYNTDVLLGILKAYQSGGTYSVTDNGRQLPVNINVDFSQQGVKKIIAFISGHVHEDAQMVYEGINCIESICSWCNTIVNPSRVVNSTTEDAQDIFSIDTELRKINIFRLGYGSDREYTF